MTDRAAPLRAHTFEDVLQQAQTPPSLVASTTRDRYLTLTWHTRTPVLAHTLKGAFEVENGNAEWRGRKILLIEHQSENTGATAGEIPISTLLMGYEIIDDLCVWIGMENRWREALDLRPGATFTYRQRRRRVLSDPEILALTQGGTFRVESITRLRRTP